MPNLSAEEARVRQMMAADVARVMEIAASLPQAPHWPQSAYLDALNPESTPRRIALVVAGPEPGRVEGFAVASLLPPQAELESIAVAAGSQQKGLGSLLFNGLIDDLQRAGVIEITLEVRATNHGAIAFYRSAGLRQTGFRPAYYADPIEDAVLMGVHFP